MLDRLTFAGQLRDAVGGAARAADVKKVIRPVLLYEGPEFVTSDEPLVLLVAERIDATDDTPGRVVTLARDSSTLLMQASSAESALEMLELVAERHRVAGLLRRYLDGTVSRTGLLSFVTEQRWPRTVRKRISGFDADRLAQLAVALEELRVPELERLVTQD